MPWLLLLFAAGALYLATGPDEPEGSLPLDGNVNRDEAEAITFAYYIEKDPRPLIEYGHALYPELSRSSTLLLSKAGRLQSVSGMQLVGNIFDVDNYTDAAAAVVSTTVDVITHPADTASGTWHAITHPSDTVSDFANACVDALHAIPGMNEAGELLKDFAKTGFGEWCLRIMATFGYYVMAPYLGCALAAISFALPGAAKAEPFVQSWITETIDRVIKTINILLQQQSLSGVGSAASEAVNKLLAENPSVQELAKEFTAQIGKASSVLTDKLGATIAQKIKEGAADALSSVTDRLAQEYGYPPDFSKLAHEAGIREDNAAAAFDLIAKTHYQASTKWDPLTGEDIVAHLRKAIYRSVGELSGTAPTVYRDPRMASQAEFEAHRQAALTELLDKPARKFWTDYYVDRARFARAGVTARQFVAAHSYVPIADAGPTMPLAGPTYTPYQSFEPGGFQSTFSRF